MQLQGERLPPGLRLQPRSPSARRDGDEIRPERLRRLRDRRALRWIAACGPQPDSDPRAAARSGSRASPRASRSRRERDLRRLPAERRPQRRRRSTGCTSAGRRTTRRRRRSETALGTQYFFEPDDDTQTSPTDVPGRASTTSAPAASPRTSGLFVEHQRHRRGPELRSPRRRRTRSTSRDRLASRLSARRLVRAREARRRPRASSRARRSAAARSSRSSATRRRSSARTSSSTLDRQADGRLAGRARPTNDVEARDPRLEPRRQERRSGRTSTCSAASASRRIFIESNNDPFTGELALRRLARDLPEASTCSSIGSTIRLAARSRPRRRRARSSTTSSSASRCRSIRPPASSISSTAHEHPSRS